MNTTPQSPTGRHLVVGAGPIGSAVAIELAAGGAEVIVVTRSGRGPSVAGVTNVAADASDQARLTELATGAVAIYNCVNPKYSRWEQDWPPVAKALIEAAAATGAVLVVASNVYAYGLPTGPMTEDTPFNPHFKNGRVRAQMYRDQLAAHESGRIRMVEVRGSDYVGPGSQSQLGDRVVPRILSGKALQLLGNPDMPHTWTYTLDMGHALVVAGNDERAYGRAWHAPSTPRTQREAVTDLARVAGVAVPKIGSVPGVLLSGLGLVNPDMRELKNVMYQVENPFVVDDSAIANTFGVQRTEWDVVLRATLESFGWTAQSAA
jgi:nucleoside-diphosphate-sugar epimerase